MLNSNANLIISPPKYEQIKNHIYEHIKSEIYPINSRLESEDELAKVYNVSRGTIRQAIQALEKEGVVETVHGKGTFVKRKNPFTQTRFVSLVFTEEESVVLNNDFYVKVFTSVVQEAKKRNIKILFTSFTPEEMEANTDMFFSHIGDGCFIVRKLPDKIANKFYDNKIPFVVIGNVMDKRNENCVIADNFKGAYMATEHLIKLGHTKILHITHDMSTISGTMRLNGYTQAMEDNGIDVNNNLILKCNTRNQSEIRARLESIEGAVDYTSIFAASDHRAIAAIDYLRSKGKKVPEDISIIGFDNSTLSDHPLYSLTTVDADKEKIAGTAVELLTELMDSPDTPAKTITLPVKLIIRNSCRRI